jgi:hypothetical protein
MCLTQPATVLARFGDEALVDIDGHGRLVSNLLIPDIEVGEEVVVGFGSILRRLGSAEADQIRSLRARTTEPPTTAKPRTTDHTMAHHGTTPRKGARS